MIDWTQPVETVPDDLNPLPIPCEVELGERNIVYLTLCGTYRFNGSGNNVTDGRFVTRTCRHYIPFGLHPDIRLRNVTAH